MKRHVLLYGLIGGLLIAALRWTEYRFLVLKHSIELYGALVAATFAGLAGAEVDASQDRGGDQVGTGTERPV